MRKLSVTSAKESGISAVCGAMTVHWRLQVWQEKRHRDGRDRYIDRQTNRESKQWGQVTDNRQVKAESIKTGHFYKYVNLCISICIFSDGNRNLWTAIYSCALAFLTLRNSFSVLVFWLQRLVLGNGEEILKLLQKKKYTFSI